MGEAKEQQPPSAPDIPFELVSEEEMAFIEAALSSAAAAFATRSSSAAIIRSSSTSLPVSHSSLSQSSSSSMAIAASSSLANPAIALRKSNDTIIRGCSTRKSGRAGRMSHDMEDMVMSHNKRMKVPKSPYLHYRKGKGLSVTDITATEWCEKQMEFILVRGKPEKTVAMKAGSTRHTELEAEVVKKVDICVQSKEDSWAVKLMNFVFGSKQLLSEGLTHNEKNLSLIDTKTRSRSTLPSEAQKRNARLQLMCYKCLWDNLVADKFPADLFYEFFRLRPQHILSKDVKEYAGSLRFDVKTLEYLVKYFRNMCSVLPSAHDLLLLRYELQADHSLLEEYHFSYDAHWFESQIQWYLKYWLGQREAGYVGEDETWKCNFCSFSAVCPLMQHQTQEQRNK
ncbi:exonuclease V, chloroplastic isoform X2 [Amborella trichopoda]|uniref:exonuclease V, chloroplastic isoform X2 n=1 Tax=Amborella trichopoda TaxID=13333 RepID=UPI0009C03D6D|nr:exonuclease V, chloroplastic isoform X2 [Amborella trichopoda]|eukprot:XP_020522183.1 exonuclease V, chloroplastic isoform X2 [Amborella trichopoda]